MKGFQFSKYVASHKHGSMFDQLFELFRELLLYTNGDANEALQWMTELDRENGLTTSDYGIGDFIEDLKEGNYIQESDPGNFRIGAKTEQSIRKAALNQIFGKLRKSNLGNHQVPSTGKGDETLPEIRPYSFGDSLDHLALTESLQEAQRNHGLMDGLWTSSDLQVRQTELKVQTSTVLMIDISHSMILYGEDRITPAKKVALALAEYIRTKYPKDTLDILVFGNDAWQIQLKDIPYLEVGPFHTNTVAGLQLAQEILRKRKNSNKQIFMITDGKPSCLKEGIHYYKNSFGLDRKIVRKTLNEAVKCRRSKMEITTFMIASDPYLMRFIEEFTEACSGKAFYSGLDDLGSFVLHDYQNNKRKHL